jgi:prolyl 4-hydroxylase
VRHHADAACPRLRPAAILFHSIQPSGALERKSLHTACPVIKGIKWSAAKWIHVGHYAMGGEPEVAVQQTVQPVPKRLAPDGCEDLDDLCPEWLAAGECERNNMYMVGTRGRPGKCIKSCNRCDVVSTTGAEARQPNQEMRGDLR